MQEDIAKPVATEPVATNPAPILSQPPRAERVWLALLLVGLGAGTIAWLAAEPLVGRFNPDLNAVPGHGGDLEELNRRIVLGAVLNSAVAFGLLGGLLGLGLGVAGGILRGSRMAAVVAGVVGLILGGSVAALASYGLIPSYLQHKDPSAADLTQAFLTHGGLWSGLGLVGGLAFGLGRFGLQPRPLITATVGGLCGAIFGTGAFEMLGAIALPFAGTAEPIAATALARFLGRMIVALGTAAGIGLALSVQVGPPVRRSESAAAG